MPKRILYPPCFFSAFLLEPAVNPVGWPDWGRWCGDEERPILSGVGGDGEDVIGSLARRFPKDVLASKLSDMNEEKKEMIYLMLCNMC